MYNLETGKPEMRRGRPAPRPAGVGPPCRRCAKGGPDKFSDLLPQNAMALQHYQECSATGNFPSDPIVARNASLLKQVEKEVDRARRSDEMKAAMMKQSLSRVGQVMRAKNF